MTEGIVTPIASSPSSTARGSGGRTIGYGEFGDPNGKPVLLFHGFGDSRLTRYPDDELTARLGIRLITFDRPGIGLTDPMKELTILDRTDDAIDLVTSLGLHDISLLGWSGGAPYALAAAGCMAGKVKRVAIVSGFGPFERPGFKRLAPREIKRVMTILKVAPWMANVMATESQKGLQGDASAAMEMSRGGLGGSADSAVLNMGGVRANVTSGAEEAFHQGPAGVANDMLLLFRFKWGFNPEDVHTPIDLWYGDDDHMTPPDVGRGLASILPQPRLRTVPGAGHLLYLRNWEEILRTLVADEAPATTTTFQAIAPVAPLSPVIETLAAASLGETTPVAEPLPAEPAAEPATAPGDVLGSAPAWSWTQPAAALQPSDQAPAETAAEREPADQEESLAPSDTPAFTPPPRVASASGDQLARLRALGFLVEAPEPVVELELAEPAAVEPEAAEPEAAEPEAAELEVAEPEAAQLEVAGPEATEPEAVAAEPRLSAVDPAPTAAPEAEAAPAEPEVARPELKLVEPQAAPKRSSLTWEPVRVPGLIIGKPRRIVPVEPPAPVAEPIAETTPQPGDAEVLAEAAPDEPEAAVLEPASAAVEHESVAEREVEAVIGQPESAGAEPDVAPVGAEAEGVGEPEPAAQPLHPRAARPAMDDAEAQRLRAAGFLVSEPATAAEAPAAEIQPTENAEAGRTRVADDELARLRAAGFAPAGAEHEVAAVDVSPEPEIAAIEAQAVDPRAVEPEAVEAEPVEAEPLVEEAETFVGEVEAAPIEEEPVAEAEPAAATAEEAPAAVVTELEEEVSETVVLSPRESDAADRLAGAGFTAPQSEPAPEIAASAADAPITTAAAPTQPHAEAGAEHVVETGVGWVETVPMDAAAPADAASTPEAERDSLPEPMVAEVEDEPAAQAPVRDKTMERLRAAGFLIGEPRGR